MLGGLGGSEIVLILALALIVFGPKKLPEIGRSFGKTLSEFRKASFSSISDLESEIKEADVKEAAPKKEPIARRPEAIEAPAKIEPQEEEQPTEKDE